MATTFSEALTPLARRMPQAVRDVEILRVAAQLDGDDFAKSAKKARDAALTWAKRRAGGNLPKEAWDHLDFELLAGGRNSAGVRGFQGIGLKHPPTAAYAPYADH